jgi:putative endonuclease
MSGYESLLFKVTDTTPNHSSRLGRIGEELAVGYLEARGYEIILRNFKVTLGRNSSGARVTGEIDLVTVHEGMLCFVEIKTRSSARFSDPFLMVNRRKRRQIERVGRRFKRIFGLTEWKSRIDIVSVTLSSRERLRIEVLRDVPS